MIDLKLSKKIREVIAGEELRKLDVCKTTKISRTTLYHIMYDDNYDPSYSTIKTLCQFLKIDLNEFIHEK